ncbi:AF4/FMR2 family member 1 isoform X2 [Fukomys damarensis]|uniref:AF4/FMR2 family member 1 isoform X2 n=1 Tax=Fukomys damarensis TaxID=885580 RepID=UPI00053FCC33|nr:AF4/FMR2 family member 1 isoform X2 [Fukomys damarensis]
MQAGVSAPTLSHAAEAELLWEGVGLRAQFCLLCASVLVTPTQFLCWLQTAASLYNEDRNLLRVREKERRNQEAHQEQEEFPEEMPLFGEPYKTAKGDELSSRLQSMLGNYEEMKEFLSITSYPQCPDASENRLGKPRCPLFPERGSSIPSSPFHASVHHQPLHTSAPRPLSMGSSSHNPKMMQLRTDPVPGPHAKGYGPLDSQHLTQDHLGQEGSSSGQHKRGDHRGNRDLSAPGTGATPAGELSPFISSLPSPVPPLSPIHSTHLAPPRAQGGGKAQGSGSNSKGCCPARSPKDPASKTCEKEVPLDSMAVVASLGVAPQPPPQTFPPPPLPSKSVVLQQKPTAYVRPMDGQDQAPNESPKLKLQNLERVGPKVPAEARLTKLKMPALPVETYSSDIHCVEEILKEMTHSWPPPLTAIHTPSTVEPSKFPFPTKDSQHISSAAQNPKQYDQPAKTHPSSQQGTSMLEDDLQLSDSEDSDTEQTPEKPPSSAAPPSAAPLLPEPVASAHSSSAESESTSDSDSSSDSESESSSSDSEENEPHDATAAEPEPPTTNKWQLDNWLSKVGQPTTAPEGSGSAEPARLGGQQGQGDSNISATGQAPAEPKAPPPKSCSRAPRGPAEVPHASRRGGHKSPAQQELPSRQTIGTKHPRRPAKALALATAVDTRASSQGDRELGPVPCGLKDPTCKEKPRVKTKGRPRAGGSREPGPTTPAPGEKQQPRSCALVPTKDSTGAASPEPFVLVPLAQVQAQAQGSGRTSGCRQAVVVQEDGHKDMLLPPLRNTRVLSPLRETPAPHSLVVKIALDLIPRVPRLPGKAGRPRKPEEKPPSTGKRQEPEKRCSDIPGKAARKRKGEAERDYDNKKIRLEKEVKPQPSLSSSSHKESSRTKTPKPSSEPSKKEMLPPPPVSSSMSSSSSQKPAKSARKRSRQEADLCQDPPQSASGTKSSQKDLSVPKHRKAQGKGSGSSSEHRGPGDTANPFPVPSLPNGNSKPGKPQGKFDKQQADFHMKEARKLKCKAESMTDKVGKAFKYLDAVLSLLECGIATESEGLATKSAYSVYSEAMDLVKFTMSLKPCDTTTQEKIFAVLCMRCQSLLNMAMFRCKKDIAIKYSRTLNEHFKSSSKVAQAPSPCIARSTGAPSPLSPMPSPASSVGSQASASNIGSSGMTATVSTPVTIQNMTSSYVTITSHVLTAFDLWEQAEALARKNKEFFAQLSTKTCTLALNSSLADLVHYARQGFQRLKQATRTP